MPNEALRIFLSNLLNRDCRIAGGAIQVLKNRESWGDIFLPAIARYYAVQIGVQIEVIDN